GAVVALLAAVAALRRKAPFAGLVWETYALAALVLLAGFVAAGDVPSQYPERMLLWIIAFTAIPVGRLADRLLEHGSRLRLLAIAGCGGFLLAAGWVHAMGLPLGIPRGDWEAGLALRESFARGHLAEDDHVVIEHLLPESTAPLVYSNHPRNVHIDALGTGCPMRLLAEFSSICPVPEWAPRVRLVLARQAGTVEALRSIGWVARARFGDWLFFFRPDGAPPLPVTEPTVIQGATAQ
ncbi:MAG TPA: hypothetical protein VM285_10320, partial [Polyangia bacterium]|nr:hypothetical protein [Polyangia bacterium]